MTTSHLRPFRVGRIVSTHPARLFGRSHAITALSLAERLAGGYGDDDPHVIAWRKELLL